MAPLKKKTLRSMSYAAGLIRMPPEMEEEARYAASAFGERVMEYAAIALKQTGARLLTGEIMHWAVDQAKQSL